MNPYLLTVGALNLLWPPLILLKQPINLTWIQIKRGPPVSNRINVNYISIQFQNDPMPMLIEYRRFGRCHVDLHLPVKFYSVIGLGYAMIKLIGRNANEHWNDDVSYKFQSRVQILSVPLLLVVIDGCVQPSVERLYQLMFNVAHHHRYPQEI